MADVAGAAPVELIPTCEKQFFCKEIQEIISKNRVKFLIFMGYILMFELCDFENINSSE
jgi:hypothetical protein